MAEIIRTIEYKKLPGSDDYEPVLYIKPKRPLMGHEDNIAIQLNHLWMFSRDKNPNFVRFMYHIAAMIYQAFGLGVIVTSGRMAEVATVIEDGIDELLKAPPEPPPGYFIDGGAAHV